MVSLRRNKTFGEIQMTSQRKSTHLPNVSYIWDWSGRSGRPGSSHDVWQHQDRCQVTRSLLPSTITHLLEGTDLWAKKMAYHAVCAYFRPYWCSVVTSAIFSSNLSNFKQNPKIKKNPNFSKKFQKNKKSQKIPKNPNKSIKNTKNPKNVKNVKNLKISKILNKFLLFFFNLNFLKIFIFCQKKTQQLNQCYLIDC